MPFRLYSFLAPKVDFVAALKEQAFVYEPTY